jgi:transcriptional regulator with XRE-family HTH domain
VELLIQAQISWTLRVTKSLHSLTYRKLTELLVQARRKSGLTQQEVADALKTHQSYVAKVEGGERRIDVVEFVEMANALGVVPSSLLKKLEAALSAKD